MKKIFCVFSMMLSSLGIAGPSTSGGGAGIVCRNNGSISVYSLDLFEGRVRYSLTIDQFVNTSDPKLQVKKALSRLKDVDQKFYQELTNVLDYIYENIVLLPDQIAMAVPLDVGTDFPPLLPISDTENCNLLAVAFWGIDNKIYISKELLFRMNRIDQASVYLHEALYKMARDNSAAKDSFKTRKIVAYLLSENSLIDIKGELRNFQNNL